MTFTAAVILDLVILGLLIYFFVMGVRRGLILSLCSLLAVFLALAGGWYLSTAYHTPLAETLEPYLLPRIESRLTEHQEELHNGEAHGFDLPDTLEGQLWASSGDLTEATAETMVASVSQLAAKAILFLGGFLAVLLLWNILCHALNLVAKLPVLHFLNKTLGGILGLIKGILLLILLSWVLCDLLGWIPQAVVSQSHLLSYFSAASLPGLPGL